MNQSEQIDNAVVRFQGVSLGYGRGAVLRDLTFSIAEGDFLGIIGPNGSGKTTILRAILRVVKPARGSIHLREGLKFGYVMQRQSLDEIFPLSVLDIVFMGRLGRTGPLRRFGSRDREKVEEALSVTGIGDLRRKRYRDLSGGQKQRTLVARALAFEPDVLLLDEPTNDLDIQGEDQIMSLVRNIHQSMGITIVLVSHLLNVLFNYVHRVMFLKDKGMRIYDRHEALSPELLGEIYETPVKVGEVDGKFVIVPGGQNNAGSC
jgi:ABC-type cobalamin/Fe3+-siderophores transport system ATPase subunit